MRALGALLLILLFAAGWWLDRPLLFACWLSAWWFCSGLALGAAAVARIHRLTGGRWGQVLRPAVDELRAAMPVILLLFLPLLAGIGEIYPWWREPSTPWFAPGFVALRFVAYGLGLWLLARAEPRGSGHAAAWLLGWMLLGTLAAADLLMSLVPGWASTIFGWLALTGQMTGGAAAAVLIATRRSPDAGPGPWRDLGNLLLMFVMLQAYLQFMQFLIIWAENLPHEISWYLPRLHTGWRWGGLALIVLQFAAPLLALLWRVNKDRPRRLAIIAAGLLAMQAFGAAWLVLPSVEPRSYAAWWMLPLAFIGMGLVAFGPPLARRRASEAAHGRS